MCARDWRDSTPPGLRRRSTIGISCQSRRRSWGATAQLADVFPVSSDSSTANDPCWRCKHARHTRAQYVAVTRMQAKLRWPRSSAGCRVSAVGIKLAAARRATIDSSIRSRHMRRQHSHLLHHIWQHRRRFWPGQDASDGAELAELAARHPNANLILAHIGGGGDYSHTFAAVRDVTNVYLDLSGSGVDRGMLDDAIAAVGPRRVLWGADLTLCTGAKLWALETLGLSAADLADSRGVTRWHFPRGRSTASKVWRGVA